MTILDIGANTGQFAKIIREILPTAKIYSFEPLPDCYEQLKLNAQRLQPHETFPFALGNQDGSTTINLNEFSPSSSLLPMEDLHKNELPHTANTRQVSIAVRRLDDLKINISTPLIIKIDVQGFELEVLRGGIDTIRSASAVVVEVSALPLYAGAPSFDDVYRFLTDECGFGYQGNVDQWYSKIDGRILQMDCLFEKS